MSDDDSSRLSLTEEEKAEVIRHASKLQREVRQELYRMVEGSAEFELAMVEVIALGRLMDDPEDRRHLDGAYDARMMRSLMGWPAP